MFWQSAVAVAAFGVRAHANTYMMDAEGMLAGRAVEHLENRMGGMADETIPTLPHLYARDTNSSSVAYDVTLNADGSINMTAWDETVTAACDSILAKLTQATNPSGTCTCYNLPVLNNSTGAFEADLRLYKISTATDTFTGISADAIMVGLSYTGASVSPISSSTASTVITKRQTLANTTTTSSSSGTTDSAGLTLLQQYYFVGQIKTADLTTNMTMAQLQALVMPTVTLSATNSSGSTVSTNVSSNEAVFVAGIFSDQIVLSTSSVAELAVETVVSGLANGTVAFVLPGVQLILFPIGLIITSVWMVAGAAIIGFGTFERMNYREQYKRRTTMSTKPMPNRI